MSLFPKVHEPREAQCLNACKGIKDPDKAITEMRFVLTMCQMHISPSLEGRAHLERMIASVLKQIPQRGSRG